MTRDLDTLLQAAAPTPRDHLDVEGVLRRGRVLGRRRTVGIVAGAVVGLLAVGGAGQVLIGSDESTSIAPISPAGPDAAEHPVGVVVGAPDAPITLDPLPDDGATGAPLATVDGLAPADLVALGPTGEVGVLAGAQLRIERDGEVVAQADVAQVAANMAADSGDADQALDDDDVRDLPRSLSFDLEGSLLALIGDGDDGMLLTLDPGGGLTSTGGSELAGDAIEAASRLVDAQVIGGRSRAVTLATGRLDGDGRTSTALHVGEVSAPHADRPPDRFVTAVSVPLTVTEGVGAGPPQAVRLPEGFADATPWNWGAPGAPVHGGALVGFTSDRGTRAGDLLLVRGRDAVMDVAMADVAVRVDGGDVPGVLQVPGTALVVGPSGALTGAWVVDVDTSEGRHVLVLAPEIGPDGADVVVSIDSSIWDRSDRLAAAVRPLLAPDGTLGVTVDRGDGRREVRVLLAGTVLESASP